MTLNVKPVTSTTQDFNNLLRNFLQKPYESFNFFNHEIRKKLFSCTAAVLSMSQAIASRQERVNYIETVLLPLFIKFLPIYSVYENFKKILCKKMFMFAIGGHSRGAYLVFAMYRPDLVTRMCYPIWQQIGTNLEQNPIYFDLLDKYGKFLKAI